MEIQENETSIFFALLFLFVSQVWKVFDFFIFLSQLVSIFPWMNQVQLLSEPAVRSYAKLDTLTWK